MLYKRCLVILATLVMGCGSELPITRDRYTEYFGRGHENCTLIQIENELNLHNLVNVKKPILNDPLWWFTYQADGYLIEISANVESEKTEDEAKADRSEFYFADISWVRKQGDGIRRRYDRNGIPSLTTNIGTPSASTDTKIGRALTRLNISIPPSIATVQKELQLGSPVNIEPPAFIRPQWYIFYKTGDQIVMLTATLDQLHENASDPKDTRQYLFTGYWTVEQKLSLGQTRNK